MCVYNIHYTLYTYYTHLYRRRVACVDLFCLPFVIVQIPQRSFTRTQYPSPCHIRLSSTRALCIICFVERRSRVSNFISRNTKKNNGSIQIRRRRRLSNGRRRASPRSPRDFARSRKVAERLKRSVLNPGFNSFRPTRVSALSVVVIGSGNGLRFIAYREPRI